MHRKQLYRDGILRIRRKAERQKQLRRLRVAALATVEEENIEVEEEVENEFSDDLDLSDSIDN